MKTRIISQRHGAPHIVSRAIHPDDKDALADSQTDKAHSWRKVRFIAGGKREKFTPGSLDMRTGNMKLGKEQTRITSDTLYVGDSGYEFKFGKISQVRVIRDEDAAELDRIDREIAALEKRRSELKREAFERGKPVVRGDAQYWTEGNK